MYPEDSPHRARHTEYDNTQFWVGDLVAKGPWVDVRSKGARGDSVTEDTAAVQAAHDALPVWGGELFFPTGDYLLDTVYIRKRGVKIRGAGWRTTRITSKNEDSIIFSYDEQSLAASVSATISDLRFYTKSGTFAIKQTVNPGVVQPIIDSVFQRVWFSRATEVETCRGIKAAMVNVLIDSCIFEFLQQPVEISKSSQYVSLTNSIFYNNYGNAIYAPGISGTTIDTLKLANLVIEEHEQSAGVGNAYAIDGSYIKDFQASNIQILNYNDAVPEMTRGIDLDNSNVIQMSNININHSNATTCRGINLDTCDDVQLSNIFTNHISHPYYFSTINRLQYHNLQAQNNVAAVFTLASIDNSAFIPTFVDEDTTPSVAGSDVFKTNTTGVTITRFDDGFAGQEITIISKGAIVFDTSTATRLIGSTVDITTANGDLTIWVCEVGGTTSSVWRLKGFVDVSVDNSAGA